MDERLGHFAEANEYLAKRLFSKMGICAEVRAVPLSEEERRAGEDGQKTLAEESA